MANKIHDLEIPKQNWVTFLRTLNQLAQSRPVRLEVINRELGDQEMVNKEPLREIDFETKGTARGALIVAVGDDSEPLFHRIDVPTRLFIAHNELGTLLETLAIQDSMGGETIIYFEELPALPEQIPEERPSAPSS
ncbi:MAG TPA: DUF5335 family protein [Myxococcaceae bacterium]|nr:DUF5335 family protein [Myxococcaceae bacterium]